MDGGILPWRRQRHDGMVYTTYEDLLKPLPNPPDGKMWVKVRFMQEDVEGCSTRWELVDKLSTTEEKTDEAIEEKVDQGEDGLPDFIEHTVMPTDTLAGLRLRYKVTAAELRKYNDFCGEQFHLCHILRIPVEGREHHVQKYRQKPTKEVIRQRFKNATGCEDYQMQTYYLESHDYDLKNSIAEYEEDKVWEVTHAARKQMATFKAQAYMYSINSDGTNAAAASATRSAASIINTPSAPSKPSSSTRRSIYTQPEGPPPSYRSFFKSMGGRRKQAIPSTYNMHDFASSEPSSDFVIMEDQDESGGGPVAMVTPVLAGGREERMPLLARQL